MARRTTSLIDSILNDLDDAREGIDSPESIEFPNNVQVMLEERPVIRDDSFINMIIRGSIFR